ncbi:hypothetical protein [Saccharopolyspora shandongensis]|uniref:hypothetical protein n=1 Tax=Saccharopolyspora shandongensis TaxID=418495 RepID=UPI0033E4E4C1
MSVDDIARNLDLAVERLSVVQLNQAASLIDEATSVLYSAVSESNDPEIAEVLETLQQASVEIGNALRLCVDVQKRIGKYKAEILGVPDATSSTNSTKSTKEPSGWRNRAIIDRDKFKYFFGKVRSNKHNTNRSKQLINELNRIRIFDTLDGHAALKRHLEQVVRSDENIVRTFTDEYGTYQIRDSLFAGPGGFLQLETAWQVTPQGLRLTTIIPRRGKK